MSVDCGVSPYTGLRSMWWFDVFLQPVRRAVRRKPSVNHWTKYGNSSVDLSEYIVAPFRLRNSSTTASTSGSFAVNAGSGGRWRPV